MVAHTRTFSRFHEPVLFSGQLKSRREVMKQMEGEGRAVGGASLLPPSTLAHLTLSLMTWELTHTEALTPLDVADA